MSGCLLACACDVLVLCMRVGMFACVHMSVRVSVCAFSSAIATF